MTPPPTGSDLIARLRALREQVQDVLEGIEWNGPQDEFYEHAVRATSQYDQQYRQMAREILASRQALRACAAALQGPETAPPLDNAGDDASREAAKRMSVRGPSSTNSLLADAWWMGRQSAIDRRGHDYRRSPSGPDLQARCEADIQLLLGPAQPEIGGPPNTAERWAARKAARSKAAGAPAPAPHGSFGYCAGCYHPLDRCSHCDTPPPAPDRPEEP